MFTLACFKYLMVISIMKKAKYSALFAVLMVTFTLSACQKDNSDTTKPNDSVTERKVETTAGLDFPIVISAYLLENEYAQDAAVADNKFFNKNLEVTGVVSSVERGMSDEVILQLETNTPYNNVSATGDIAFDKHASALNVGDRVTLLCIGAGQVLNSPLIDLCSVKPIQSALPAENDNAQLISPADLDRPVTTEL